MNQFKQLTHYFAVAFAAVYGFLLTPAGEALIKQYPRLAMLSALMGTVSALYFTPKGESK